MHTKESIIEELARNKTIETIVSNIVKSHDSSLEDLCQDLYIDLLQKDEKKIIKLYEDEELNFFITKMVINNIYSQNSPYYTKYKKFLRNSDELKDYIDE